MKPKKQKNPVYRCQEDPDCGHAFIDEADLNEHIFTGLHCEKCGYGGAVKYGIQTVCEGCMFEAVSFPSDKTRHC